MLSRREKLLLQPWEQRRYDDHRTKVQSALPAIDTSAPCERPHVALKLKKCQRELDRKNKIQSDNFGLLQRLNAIMKVNRLDNHWIKPLPNFQRKVGLFYNEQSLRGRLAAKTGERKELERGVGRVRDVTPATCASGQGCSWT